VGGQSLEGGSAAFQLYFWGPNSSEHGRCTVRGLTQPRCTPGSPFRSLCLSFTLGSSARMIPPRPQLPVQWVSTSQSSSSLTSHRYKAESPCRDACGGSRILIFCAMFHGPMYWVKPHPSDLRVLHIIYISFILIITPCYTIEWAPRCHFLKNPRSDAGVA
jgi:hypothetical protein